MSAIIVFIVDQSGIIAVFKQKLARFLTKNNSKSIYNYDNIDLRPFECSLCMIFWCGLILLLAERQFSLFNLAILCLLSFLSRTINDLFVLFQSLFDTLINYIYKKLK